MTRYVLMLFAAYGLLAIESALPQSFAMATPYGTFLWMLLPWLATLPDTNTAILASAVYGLMLDALTGHHPGLLIAVTVIAVCVLRQVISTAALETCPRVFIVSFICGTVMAMLLATSSILAGTLSVSPVELITSITVSTASASLVAATMVTMFRVFARQSMSTQELVQ